METRFADKTKLLFNETIQLTQITEYGVNWNELTTGNITPPPQGARFDISFEGILGGPVISGTIKGIDYLEVRSDGRFMMNIYATVTTGDGEIIALFEDGIVVPSENGRANLQLNLKFTTNSRKYGWLNKMQVWGIAVADMNRGEIKVQAYTGDFYPIPKVA